MVFGMMGAPIEEHFQSGNEEDRYYRCDGEDHKKTIGDNVYCHSKRIDSLDPNAEESIDWSGSEHNSWSFDCSDDVAIIEGTGSNKKIFCKKLNEGSNAELNSGSEGNSESQTTSALDPEEEEAEAENSGSSETTAASEESKGSQTTSADESINKFENYDEEEHEEEHEDDDEEEDEENEEDEEDEDEEEEGFTGSMNIEHFSGKQIQDRVLNLNLLLKSLLFACLFYIVAHQDTKTYLLKNLKFLKGFDYLIVSMVIYFVCYYILSIFV